MVYSDKLDNFVTISKLNVGAAVIATGIVTLTPDAKQPFEIQAVNIAIEGDSTPDYPLQKKRHSFEYLRTINCPLTVKFVGLLKKSLLKST